MSRTLLMAGASWTPARLTLLRGWYRADLDNITLVGADVDAWADQSGVGNHLTAPAAGNRPLYVASDAALGSRPVIEFDGVAEYLRIAAFSMGAAFNACTFAMVGYGLAYTNGDAFWEYTAVVPRGRQAVNKYQVLTPDAGGDLNSTTDESTPSLWVFSWDGANTFLYRSAAQQDTAPDVTASVADGAAFSVGSRSGGASPANCRIAEMIVTRAAITAPELANLAAYATARYGVT